MSIFFTPTLRQTTKLKMSRTVLQEHLTKKEMKLYQILKFKPSKDTFFYNNEKNGMVLQKI